MRRLANENATKERNSQKNCRSILILKQNSIQSKHFTQQIGQRHCQTHFCVWHKMLISWPTLFGGWRPFPLISPLSGLCGLSKQSKCEQMVVHDRPQKMWIVEIVTTKNDIFTILKCLLVCEVFKRDYNRRILRWI